MNYEPVAAPEDDDDEFEDDDENPGETGTKKQKISAVGGLACSLKHVLQEKVGGLYQAFLEEYLTFQAHEMVLGFLAQYNEYYPMPEKWQSVQMLCTGIETREPLHWFDNNRLVFTYELNKNAVDPEQLCDSEQFMR